MAIGLLGVMAFKSLKPKQVETLDAIPPENRRCNRVTFIRVRTKYQTERTTQPMLDSENLLTPAAGFDAHAHFRVPSDFMPAVHAHARRRGLTSASWLRMVILEALERDAAAQQRAAA